MTGVQRAPRFSVLRRRRRRRSAVQGFEAVGFGVALGNPAATKVQARLLGASEVTGVQALEFGGSSATRGVRCDQGTGSRDFWVLRLAALKLLARLLATRVHALEADLNGDTGLPGVPESRDS